MKWLSALAKTKSSPEDYARLERLCARFGPNEVCLFDAGWYVEQSDDPAIDAATAFRHYLTQGWIEGRDPSPQFDTRYYLETYTDVARSGLNPLQHYVEHGHREGRTTRPVPFAPPPEPAFAVDSLPETEETSVTLSDNARAAFDGETFLRRYAFLGNRIELVAAEAADYYATHERARRVSPNPQFDELWYLTQYSDIGEALERGDVASGYCHFCDDGWRENRVPSELWLRAAETRQPGTGDAGDLSGDAEASIFLAAFPFVTAEDFMARIGAVKPVARPPEAQAEPEAESAAAPESAPERLPERQWPASAAVRQAFDGEAFRRHCQFLGHEAGFDAAEALDWYLGHEAARRISPNPQFDEAWYLDHYDDIAEAVTRGDVASGFCHFCDDGWREKRMPSERWLWITRLRQPGEEAAIGDDAEAQAFLAAFPFVTPGEFAGRIGVVAPPAPAPPEPETPEIIEKRWPASVPIRQAFDGGAFLRHYEFFGNEAGFTRLQALDFYLTHARARRISPNLLFDEQWYLSQYPDVALAIENGEMASGFCHFCDDGWSENRMPSDAWLRAGRSRTPMQTDPDLADSYLLDDADGLAFLAAFPFITPVDFVARVGLVKKEARGLAYATKSLMAAQFDAEFYLAQWDRRGGAAIEGDVFEHYYSLGARQGLSPNARFDEAFYLAFYRDIREIVEEGVLLSGFEHYLLSGRREGRLARHDMQKALELSVPGVTQPVLLSRVDDLERRMAGPRVLSDDKAPLTLWIVLPRLDPDIAFGGYRALFELVVALRRFKPLAQYRFKALLTEVSSTNIDYFLHMTQQPHIREVFAGLECDWLDIRKPVTLNPDDYVLAYSAWDAHIATRMAVRTRHPRFLQLVQEYEAIFHDYNSHHALTNAGFAFPCYPVFNSGLLQRFFATNGYGVFADGASPVAGRDYAAFEHIPTPAPKQTAAAMDERAYRTCLVYARPEGHAARNLFEILLLALRKATGDGVFGGDDWRFVGIGCLSEMPAIELEGGHWLEMVPKLPEAEYKALLASVDIGVSLMYAPHPSVVPFELCTTGALVVVNTFVNRDAAFFLDQSTNFIPVRPTIEGVAQGLAEAASRVANTRSREKNALKLGKSTWSATFNDDFLAQCLAGTAG